MNTLKVGIATLEEYKQRTLAIARKIRVENDGARRRDA